MGFRISAALSLPAFLLIVGLLSITHPLSAQDLDHPGKQGLLGNADLVWLREMTGAVLEKARLYPGVRENNQTTEINRTGGMLIRPGGNYPSFWIRDYAMSLESGLIRKEEQAHMLLLAASAQCAQTRITQGGCLIPYGAIADHIRPEDGLPVFFPGTYSYEEQGTPEWGKVPPYDDQFYFIHMAWYYVLRNREPRSQAKTFLLQDVKGFSLISRAEIAFAVPPAHESNQIVYTTDAFRGVDFGFRDAETITGDLCFSSILRCRAARELTEMFLLLGEKKKAARYGSIAEKIQSALPYLFADERGMLRASTGRSRQADVWSTALAVYYDLLHGEVREQACRSLANAYRQGTLSVKGNIRHILTTDDFSKSTAWELSLAEKNTYQNGAYWGTPTGWVCFAIAQADRESAGKLAAEYIADLRATDFRKGASFGGPYECFSPPEYKQNPVYLTTVSCPYAVFRAMQTGSAWPAVEK